MYNGNLHERLRHGAEESKSQSLRPGLLNIHNSHVVLGTLSTSGRKT